MKQGLINPTSFQDINTHCINQFNYSYQYIIETDSKLSALKSDLSSFNLKKNQLESIIYDCSINFTTEYIYQGKYYNVTNTILDIQNSNSSIYSIRDFVISINKILDLN